MESEGVGFVYLPTLCRHRLFDGYNRFYARTWFHIDDANCDVKFPLES